MPTLLFVLFLVGLAIGAALVLWDIRLRRERDRRERAAKQDDPPVVPV